MTIGVTRWTPMTDPFRDRFSRLFDLALEERSKGSTEEVSNRRWMPAVDIREDEERLILEAELPGMSKDDVQLSLENNVLTLSGERHFEKEVDKTNYHRIERAYGPFSRSFTLPRNVRTEAVAASFSNGLLTVVLPKVDEAKPRRVEIH